MIGRSESIIMDVVTRVMVPVIQIFALYVVFHGHDSPGGGFQGGALLAASVLLQRVVLGHDRSQAGFPSGLALPLAVAGILVYLLTGILSMALGGNFLEYDRLPFGLGTDWLHYAGILVVEIGIALAVTGAFVAIFDDLVSGERRGVSGGDQPPGGVS